MSDKTFTTLLLGDVYGDHGCRVLYLKLSTLIKKYRADFVVVNGENAFKGFGLIPGQVDMLFGLGVDVITSGNHIWQQEEILPYLDSQNNLLRPANYGNLVQGHGYTVKDGVCVMNLQGRVNMFPIEDPFKWATDILKKLDSRVKTIFVDFHAESPEEKEAMGFFLDGKVTAVVGTEYGLTDTLLVSGNEIMALILRFSASWDLTFPSTTKISDPPPSSLMTSRNPRDLNFLNASAL